MGDLTAHFSRAEFACRCGQCESIPPSSLLLRELEDIRSILRSPIHILSGYRCYSHNKTIGGAAHSRHLKAEAADIVCRNESAERVYMILDSLYPDQYGIGLYPSFVHFDVRPTKARW